MLTKRRKAKKETKIDSFFESFLKTIINNINVTRDKPGNRNKGKGNGAGLAWESQSHWFADKFGITHAHSFGTDTQYDYSQGNFLEYL